MAYIDEKDILSEIEKELRNNDILTHSERNTANATTSGTLVAADNMLINVSNVKNIRSVTIATVTKSFGTDYTYDLDYNDSGTKKTKISFTSAQTGAFSISYDYGNDRIFADFPKPTLSANDFPRIGFDFINSNIKEIELGAYSNETNYTLQINCYARTRDKLIDMKNKIKEFLLANKKNFYYFPFITITGYGPTIASPFSQTKQVLQRNIDCIIRFVYEK